MQSVVHWNVEIGDVALEMRGWYEHKINGP